MLPVFRAQIDEETQEAAREVLDSGWLGMGAWVDRFETELGRFLELSGDRQVVAVNTGTSALHLALLAAGVGPGDEVLTPAFNNIGDFQAITACGAKPVFVDVREEDLGIDVVQAERLVGPAVKAILPLHYMGVPCDISGVYAIAHMHELRVVEDACHAVGSHTPWGTIGSWGDMQCFSFDPIKTMTCIDGGAVTADEEDAEKIRRARLLGVVQPTKRQYVEVGRALASTDGGYDVVDQGFRYHLANLHAAVGLSQLRHLPDWISSRREAADAYNAALAGLPIRLPPDDLTGVSLFGYTIRVPDGRREELRRHLAERDVDTGVHWRPGHWLSWLKNCRGADRLPVSDQVGLEITTLPLWSVMDDEDLARVIDAIWTFYG